MVKVFEPIVPECYVERLSRCVDLSWDIFRSRFIAGRHPILREAPFQHHFANVISSVGQLFCTSRDDMFHVDLETRVENIRGKSKFVDISCSFPNAGVKCAIELKFKTAQQGAQDYGRIDAYVDIESLELVCPVPYTFGRFFMITDSRIYRNKSLRGVGTLFAMHDGYCNPLGTPITCGYSKGREHVTVTLANQYTFNWEHSGNWHFLAIAIPWKKMTDLYRKAEDFK